jgi:hypothetical protein
MTPTEWAVLRDVATTRLATASQLETLQALRTPMHVRSFRRLLERLNARQVLFRLDRVIGGRRAGSSGFVYGIDVVGQRLLNHPPRRPWTPRPSWLEHALQTTELYVELKQAEALGRLALTTFQAEPECWRTFEAPGGGIVALKPDAFIELEHGEYFDRFFIEIDMATESPTTLRGKAKAYLAYLGSGTEQAKGEVFPFVAWLAPTDERAAVIADAVVTADQTQTLHRVGTFDRAVETLLDDPP